MANSNSSPQSAISPRPNIGQSQAKSLALPEDVSDTVNRALGLKSELHPFTRTRLYGRLAAHFGKLGIPLVFNPQRCAGDIVITAGDVKIDMYFSFFCISGRREALQAAGFKPEWFPGAPGQKKTVGRASTTIFERHRGIKLSASGPNRINGSVELDDDEAEELRRIHNHDRDSESTSARITEAQSRANKQIAALPASAQEFRCRNLNAFCLLVESATVAFSVNAGGYSIAPNDLEDIKSAMGDALNALRDASIRFDERKRQAEILQIIDENINSAMPMCDRSEVRHG
jgi:hypothetical protein